MRRTAIIGYGNSLRSDDGLGWRAAECLRGVVSSPHVEVVTCHQLMPEHAELLSRVQRVVFIDACAGGVAGTWTCQRIVAAPSPVTAFSHHLNPVTLLVLAQTLFGACPAEALVVTVAGASFGYGTELSPAVRAALPPLVACVRAYILRDGPASR
jgi:hydrogenase maturation protease